MHATTFEELGLSQDTLDALNKKGFTEPSEIQARTIPVILQEECDIIGQAQTGTGKTAAFGLPIIDTLTPNTGHIQTLILTPTRELTLQVSKELSSLIGKKRLQVTPIYGGESIEKQIRQLKKQNDIIVGTPGRLIDHIRSKRINLSHIKYVVLDEADEMLNGGFIEDIEHILSKTNPDRKTLLFSATMPDQIQRLAQQYMKSYTTIKTAHKTLATSLTEQIYYEIRESDKLETLCRVIDAADDFYGLIFCRTKRDVDTITEKILARRYNAEAMHGDLSQFQRERVLQKFRQKTCSILIVTDVASRGLDITGLSHVINYALPQDAESYVHRVGRTGRAGKSGKAITFVTPSEFRKFTYIQRVAKTKIEKESIPSIETILATKKKRLETTILKSIETCTENDYIDFAEKLLHSHSPKEAIAGILKIAFQAEFSQAHYTSIKKPSRSQHNDHKPQNRKSNYGNKSFRSTRNRPKRSY